MGQFKLLNYIKIRVNILLVLILVRTRFSDSITLLMTRLFKFILVKSSTYLTHQLTNQIP